MSFRYGGFHDSCLEYEVITGGGEVLTCTPSNEHDWLRTADYFFRYDHGVTHVFPRSLPGRLLFGRLISSSAVLRAAEKLHFLLDGERPTITLDTFVPISRAGEFFDWLAQTCAF